MIPRWKNDFIFVSLWGVWETDGSVIPILCGECNGMKVQKEVISRMKVAVEAMRKFNRFRPSIVCVVLVFFPHGT